MTSRWAQIYMVLVTVMSCLATSEAWPNRRTQENKETEEEKDECDNGHDKPFCGSNLVTYLNVCEFQKALFENPKLTIVQDGACDCEPRDQYEWNPLCGTNNQSYANICEYVQAKDSYPDLHVKDLGLCRAMLDRDTITWRELQKLKVWSTFMPAYLYEVLSSRKIADARKRRLRTQRQKK